MKFAELPNYIEDIATMSDYHQIQAVIGLIPQGESTTTRHILHLTNVVSSSITLYMRQMNCLETKINYKGMGGEGDLPTLITRKDLPGVICNSDCKRSSSCLLKLAKEHAANRERFPKPIRANIIV